MSEALSIWTIFDRPKDEPTYRYVARRFTVTSVAMPTESVLRSDDIEALRNWMRASGLVCIGREVGDEDHIVESWL